MDDGKNSDDTRNYCRERIRFLSENFNINDYFNWAYGGDPKIKKFTYPCTEYPNVPVSVLITSYMIYGENE